MNLFGKNELFLLEEVVSRNFASKYKGSVLGILWSILKPLCITIILTVVFSTLFNGRVENLPVYILSGKCIFDFFVGSVGLAMNSIYGNQNILKKTAAPKHIFVIGSILSEFINFLISLILLIGVMIVTKTTFHFEYIPLSIIPIIESIIMFLGLGLMLSILRVYYTDMLHLWGVLTQILFYATAIFYPMEIVPEPFYDYVILNPIYWIVNQFRDLMVYGVMPDLIYMINLLLMSLIILLIGIIIFKKYEKKVAMRF